MWITISYIAAFLTTISFLPQAIKTVKTKDTKDISLIMYIMFTIGTAMWIIYAIFTKQYSVFIANGITFVFAMIILTFKIINVKKGENI